jgi:hypothetical protein
MSTLSPRRAHCRAGLSYPEIVGAREYLARFVAVTRRITRRIHAAIAGVISPPGGPSASEAGTLTRVLA